MTLLLSESDVHDLLTMKDVVAALEEAFRREAKTEAVNSPRTRSAASGSSLNVMHANLQYLGRAGVKCYLSSKGGTRFMFVLFDSKKGEPLAIMGADVLGRTRTGAASAVATKYMHKGKDFTLAVCGSGWQALTQVLALREVAEVSSVRVWSPTASHRTKFAKELGREGFEAESFDTVDEALSGAEVASTITSSKVPFVSAKASSTIEHLNLCGSNSPDRAEALPDVVGSRQTVAVDDIAQARYEAGDLIQAARVGQFKWDAAFELKDIVSGRVRPAGKTLFKSMGAALEDVATASLAYDRALKAGGFPERDFSGAR